MMKMSSFSLRLVYGKQIFLNLAKNGSYGTIYRRN